MSDSLTKAEIGAILEAHPELGGDQHQHGDGQQLIPCPHPDHDDDSPSFSVNYDEGVGHCYVCSGFSGNFLQLAAVLQGEGESVSAVRKRLSLHSGAEDADLFEGVDTEAEYVPPQREGRFPRYSAEGVELAGKIIMDGEPPRWYGVEGGDYVNKLSKTAEVTLYGLPDLLAKPDAKVLFVEGERCAALAAALLPGLAVVTAGSATEWKRAGILEPLRGRSVVIWPDADKPGKKMLGGLTAALLGMGCQVFAANTVGEVTDKNGLDIADLVLEGGDQKYAPSDHKKARHRVMSHLASVRPMNPQKETSGASPCDNRMATVIGTDADTGRMVIFDNRDNVERVVSKSHGSGKNSLPEFGTLDEFIEMMGAPRYSLNKQGETVKLKHKLGGEFGDEVLDCWNICAKQKGVTIDRNARPWTGAVKVGEKIVYNLNNSVVVDGKLRKFTAPLVSEMISSIDGLGHIYDPEAADSYDPAPMRRFVKLAQNWGFTSGRYAAHGLIGWHLFSVWSGSASVNWKPHYSLIGEAGAGKSQLVFHYVMPLLCGLSIRKDKFSEAALYGKDAARSLGLTVNEANASDRKGSNDVKNLVEYMTHASDEGKREVMKNNPDEGARVTICRPPVFSLRNTMDDGVERRVRRRVFYEHLRETDVFDRPEILREMREIQKQIGNRLVSMLIKRTTEGHFLRRTEYLIENYRKLAPGTEYRSEQLVQAVPLAVAMEAALGWDEAETLRMIDDRCAVMFKQVNDEAVLLWEKAIEAILYSVVLHRGKAYRVYQLRQMVLNGEALKADDISGEAGDPQDLLLGAGIYAAEDGCLAIRSRLEAFKRLIQPLWHNVDGLLDAIKTAPGEVFKCSCRYTDTGGNRFTQIAAQEVDRLSPAGTEADLSPTPPEEPPEPAPVPLDDSDDEPTPLERLAEVYEAAAPEASLAEILKGKGEHIVSFDLETKPFRHGDKEGALNWRPVEDSAIPCVFSWSHQAGKSGVIDLRKADGIKEMREITKRVKMHYARKNRALTLVAHNAPFDIHLLAHHHGWPIPTVDKAGFYECTKLRAHLIGGQRDYSLDALATELLGHGKDDTIYEHLAKNYGGNPTRKSQGWRICEADWPVLEKYARIDAEVTLELFQYQAEVLAELNIRDTLKLELEVLTVFLQMEAGGIAVDGGKVDAAINQAGEKLEQLDAEIVEKIGFVPSGNKQMQKVYGAEECSDGWYTKNGSRLLLTPSGQPSFAKKSLEQLTAPADVEIGKMLAARSDTLTLRDKFLGTYLRDAMREGYVYPGIDQVTEEGDRSTTRTGRTAMKAPPMHQIPSRDDDAGKAQAVRECFTAPPGFSIIEGDFSSLEQRVAVAVTGVEPMIERYRADPEFDIYSDIGSRSGLDRTTCKVIVLALNFGMGLGRTAMLLGLPYRSEMFERDGRSFTGLIPENPDEVQGIIDRFYDAMPGFKMARLNIIGDAERLGYYTTPFGRRVPVDVAAGAFRAAFGNLCQSTGADVQKYALARVAEVLAGWESRIFLQTHDSITIYLHDDEHSLIPEIKAAAEAVNDSGTLAVPMVFEMNKPAGDLWLATKGQ